ncbi:MAG TPA: ferritin-like domain-containing protein [Flavitalea sp.]|nr:ferritin-like domain-containing protein [Flavitalea sp.]
MPRQAKASKGGNSSVKSSPGSKGNTATAERQSVQPTAQGTMLEKFIVDQLKDIYWAEKALLKALPKMQKAATTEELKSAFQEHLEVTREQVERLDQAFEMMGKKAQGKKCEAMEGLIKESESIIEETEKGSMTRDVALIMAAQKVEHYEIASYGGLVQLTNTIGLTDVSELLDQTLQEEKEADELLTSIAENNINLEAEQEGEGSEEEE